MRITYTDARRGAKPADLCDNCAGQMPGRAAARRSRRKSATASGANPARSPSALAARGVAAEAKVYDRSMPAGLALLVGPANAGKVALLLDRYLDRARA